MARPRRWDCALVVAALLSIAVVGCGPFVDQSNVQNRADEIAGVVGDRHVVGQTFISRCAGLSQIELQIARLPDVPSGAGLLYLSLRSGNSIDSPTTLIASIAVPERELSANQWVTLTFPAISTSQDQQFSIQVWSNVDGVSPVTVWATSHRGSDDRIRRLDRVPRPGTLVYRAYCDPSLSVVVMDRIQFLHDQRLLWPIALALCIVPGLGMYGFLSGRHDDLAAFLGNAVGWSVLAAPLGLVVLGMFHAANATGAVLLALGVAGLGWRLRADGPPLRSRVNGPSWIALVALLGALVIRVGTTTGLVGPLWVDSVQHAAIVHMIQNANGVPSTYGPTMPDEVFDYHFGFHALAAFAGWLSNGTSADAVLAVGQVLSALAPLAAYSFACDLVGSRRAAAVAAIFVGVVMTQPTYLVTWGRYTELAGVVAVPAAYRAIVDGLRPRSTLRSLAVGVIATVAIVLVHPRVALFLVCLVLARVGSGWLANRDWRTVRTVAARAAALCLTSGLVLSPWMMRLWATQRGHTLVASAWVPLDFPWGIVVSDRDRWVGALAIVGVIALVIRQRSIALTLVTWFALIVVAANPSYFGLPIYLWITYESVAIALFLPMAVLGGYAIDSIASTVGFDSLRRPPRLAIGAAAVVLALSRAPSLMGVVNPCCGLVAPEDVAAWNWVRTHTPSNALFLINGYRWSNTIWAGTDAGYWLPVVAGRQTTLPPLFYATGPADTKTAIDDAAATIDRADGDPTRLESEARKLGASYVFVGRRGGAIDPGRLIGHPDFRVVYQEGGAWIFGIRGTTGAGDSNEFGDSRAPTGDHGTDTKSTKTRC